MSRLGRLSGWRWRSLFVTRFANDLACVCLSSDVSERRGRCRPGARLLACSEACPRLERVTRHSCAASGLNTQTDTGFVP